MPLLALNTGAPLEFSLGGGESVAEKGQLVEKVDVKPEVGSEKLQNDVWRPQCLVLVKIQLQAMLIIGGKYLVGQCRHPGS